MSVLPPKCLTPKQTTIPKYKQVERDGRHIQCLPSFFSSRFSQGFFTASRFLSKSKSPETIEISGLFWSCWADSNCRPHPYQGCALPTELQQQMATRKGFEPSTSGVTGRHSNQLSYWAIKNFYGGRNRDRTCDPLLVRQVLSQLSYATVIWWPLGESNPCYHRERVVS